MHGCIPNRGAYNKQFGGGLSLERCASPVHRIHQRWSNTSVGFPLSNRTGSNEHEHTVKSR
ncbi:hypothetical protein BZL30_0428 [Mycobacterium kansasii]|uniref:Uncharacterized protein n=1 Tax=Mycobacterium kansasii TaxID=1768 RepID=A0A1V3XRD8_MYCKA|nr:hypothetical protein BZL30_0428 [Mycobacterium kansasii]